MIYTIRWNTKTEVTNNLDRALEIVKEFSDNHPMRIIFINGIRREAKIWIAGGTARIEDYCHNRPKQKQEARTIITITGKKNGREVTYKFIVILETPLIFIKDNVGYRWNGDQVVTTLTNEPLLKKAYIPI